jgi:hypothetical protein
MFQGLLLHQLLTTTGKGAGISGSMAATLFSRCAHIPAFFYYLELKSTLLANINLSLFHLMTIRHCTNLLSAAQTVLTLYYRMGVRGSQVKGNLPSGRREAVVKSSIWMGSSIMSERFLSIYS